MSLMGFLGPWHATLVTALPPSHNTRAYGLQPMNVQTWCALNATPSTILIRPPYGPA
jgi:hypothetical protein